MAKRYGVPYQGSKNAIARDIVDLLPAADTLIDIFAGGCAITHVALESGKWQHVIANDINDMPLQLFYNAAHGKYRDEARWISREDFSRRKDIDPYVKYCWSFSNNGRNYLYSREIEPYKMLLHKMLFADTTAERYLAWKKLFREAIYPALSQTAEELPQVKKYYYSQSLESLERLQSLEISNLNYTDVPIRGAP